MANDILDGYVFVNTELLLNLYPRAYSGDIAKEVFPGDILYVCYDMDEAEGALYECQDRVMREVYDAGLEPDELQLAVSAVEIIPIRALWDSGKIAEMGLLLEPFYNIEE